MSKTNPVTVTYGSCIDLDLVYKDSSGAVEDVSSDSFTVEQSTPASIDSDAVITKTDPVNGTIHFHLSETNAEKLSRGNINRFRVKRTFPDGCADVTEEIWINVK